MKRFTPVLHLERHDVTPDGFGRIYLESIAPDAARMFFALQAVEMVHGANWRAKHFHTLADCGAMAATFADTGVMR